MYILGETRREAINRVQEILGPATSRPLAELTFWDLAKDRKITMDEDGLYLMEDMSESDMRDSAVKSITNQNVRHFQVTRNHMTRARVAYKWSAKMSSLKTALAPDLESAEGYSPGIGIVEDETKQ